MREILISIHPIWCELITSGKKTDEVRKTKPKLEIPFKCYVYETQGRTETPWVDEDGHYIFKGRGQVIGEFVCDCMTGLKADNMIQAYYNNTKGTCLTDEDLRLYADGKKVYYWHISNLVIYDKPKELSEFGFKRPPQSWCYVKGGAV